MVLFLGDSETYFAYSLTMNYIISRSFERPGLLANFAMCCSSSPLRDARLFSFVTLFLFHKGGKGTESFLQHQSVRIEEEGHSVISR